MLIVCHSVHYYAGGLYPLFSQGISQEELQVREGKDKVRASWTRGVITHDLGRQAPVIDVAKPGYAPFLWMCVCGYRMYGCF